jgi:hypothetical protein
MWLLEIHTDYDLKVALCSIAKKWKSPWKEKPLSMTNKITKTMLQQAHQEHNQEILNLKIDSICEMVLKVARRGDTSFLYPVTKESIAHLREWAPYDYVPDIDELIEALIPRFGEDIFIRYVANGILIGLVVELLYN